MQAIAQAARASRSRLWAGLIISGIPAAFMLVGGIMKMMNLASVKEGLTRLGYPENFAVGIGVVELACIAIYLIPRTTVLGAIIVTGYLGGATATHVRVGDPFYFPVIFGVLIWAGLFLREERLRSLIPMRR